MICIVATNRKPKPLPAGNLIVNPGETIVLGEYTEEQSAFIKALKLSGLGITIENIDIEEEIIKEPEITLQPDVVIEPIPEFIAEPKELEIQTEPEIIIPNDVIDPVPEVVTTPEAEVVIDAVIESELVSEITETEPPAPEKKKGGKPKKEVTPDIEMPVSE